MIGERWCRCECDVVVSDIREQEHCNARAGARIREAGIVTMNHIKNHSCVITQCWLSCSELDAYHLKVLDLDRRSRMKAERDLYECLAH